DEKDPIFAAESVGAAEIDELGSYVLAPFDCRSPDSVEVIELAENPARVCPCPAHDDGEAQPGALNRPGSCVRVAGADAKHPRDDQAGNSGELSRHEVARRLQHRFGAVDYPRAVSADELAQIFENTTVLLRFGDQ